jgi:peptide/nickel transport system permease protein
MARTLLFRIGQALITLWIVSILVFAASQVIPGDVGRTILGPYATNSQVAQLDHKLGTDRPLIQQYWTWISNFARGDWGESAVQNQPVRPLVLTAFKNSVYLGLFALVLIIPISIFFGVLAALHYGRATDRVISVTGLSLIALPEFVMGVTVALIFGVKLRWLPVDSSVPSATDPVDWFRQFLLPAIPLMFVLFGYISRMARAGTVEALQSNYVRTATLKGLPTRTVIRRHVLRNSLLPTITVIASQTGYLIGGLFVVETLFHYNGVGTLLLQAATQKDYPMLEAGILTIGVVYMLATLVADLLYSYLNPRIRYQGLE